MGIIKKRHQLLHLDEILYATLKTGALVQEGAWSNSFSKTYNLTLKIRLKAVLLRELRIISE